MRVCSISLLSATTRVLPAGAELGWRIMHETSPAVRCRKVMGNGWDKGNNRRWCECDIQVVVVVMKV